MAGMLLPLVIVSSARAMSAACCGRSLGSFARHDMTSVRQRRRQVAAEFGDRLGRLAHVRGEHALRRAVGEDGLSGQQLVRHRAERVDVGAVVDVRIARRLLGRHVRRRADGRADLRERRAAARRPRRR